MLTKTLIAGTAGLALAIPLSPALAKSGDDRVEVSSEGQCSSSARWELKVKERDGGVEVEFEVDSNVVGQDWDYTLTGPNGVLSAGTRTTTAPSGSFSVEVKTSGSATDAFKGVATNADQTCDSTVNVGVGDDPRQPATTMALVMTRAASATGRRSTAPVRRALTSSSRSSAARCSASPNSRWTRTSRARSGVTR